MSAIRSRIVSIILVAGCLAAAPGIAAPAPPPKKILTPLPHAASISLTPLDDEIGPEVIAPAKAVPASCRVACGAATPNGDTCATLAPLSDPARDDGADLIACLRQCKCVRLVPNPANTGNNMFKFIVRQSISLGGSNTTGYKLLGASPAGAKLPLLKAAGTCTAKTFIDDTLSPKVYKPVLDLNRSPGSVVSDLRISVADFKQSCMTHSLAGNFAINAVRCDDLRIQNVRIVGQQPALNLDSGGGVIGGIQVSFSKRAMIRGNTVLNAGYAIGDSSTVCQTASGVVGIKIADSNNVTVDNNDLVHASFGIAVVNENKPTDSTVEFDASGSKVTNNRIVGAALQHCQVVGTFDSNQNCNNAIDGKKVRCSQGRALRFEGLSNHVIHDVCAENNWAIEFGGREGQTNASGFDLSGYVQHSRFRSNVFDGRGAHVEFTFQPRAVPDPKTPFDPMFSANTVDNIVQGNVFVNGDTCNANFQTLQHKPVVADQCGLGRSSNTGNNLVGSSTGNADCLRGPAPRGCTRTDVPAPPSVPRMPMAGDPPPSPNPNACGPL